MYVILVNSGVYEGGKVFKSLEEVESLLYEWSGGEELLDEEGEVVGVMDLVEVGGMGEKIEVWNEKMVEMGDDFVELSVVELKLED